MKNPSMKFTLQRDQTDCGVACLASIIQFHGGECSLEVLRKLSGTSKQGTTLLGLLQAAEALGFDAEGLVAESVDNIATLAQPVILHVVVNKLQHYIVYYPQDESSFNLKNSKVNIGDPARGMLEISIDELDRIWQSKTLLKLIPKLSFEKKQKQLANKKRWIFELIRDDLQILLVSVFIGIIITLIGISTAIFSQKLIDDIIPKENIQKLTLSLVLVALLLLIRSGLTYLRGLLMLDQGMNFNNRIIQNFYSKLLQLPKSFFDTRKTGELIARMNDTRRIQLVLSSISGNILIDLLLLIVSLVFVFTYSFVIGFIIFASLPIYFLILYWFNNPIIKIQKEVMGRYSLVESNFVDTIQGVADIKAQNKQYFFEQINAAIYGEFQKKINDLGKLNFKFGLVSEITSSIFITTVFGVSSVLVLSQQLKLGEMVALLGMASGILPSVTRLVVANIQIQEALVAFDRMFEFTSIEKEQSSLITNAFSTDNIQIENICFRFPGRGQILKNVSLNLKLGEISALIGESGGGKSRY